MALQTFGTLIGSGNAVVLGTTDSAFVVAGGLVSSSDGVGIWGYGPDQTVDVQGSVVGWVYGISLGTALANTNDHVLIEPSGFVATYGGFYAIAVGGPSCLVENRGRVYGTGVSGGEPGNGVGFTGTEHGSRTLINSGTIEADGIGVAHYCLDTLFVTNSGTIRAPIAYANLGFANVDHITNTGSVIGDIHLGESDDFYGGAQGHFSGRLLAGSGKDTVIGGIDSERFEGGAGNDKLTGNGGSDILKGDAGDDVLAGGLGRDMLTGGADNDFFVFNTAPNTSFNRDVITDFNHINDTFELENAVFKALGGAGALKAAFFFAGAAAHDGDDHIVYNHSTGVLSYDVNGSAAGGVQQIAVLTNHPTLTAGDFVVI